MARNEEKAQSMLNRWLAYKRGEPAPQPKESRRPFLASQCQTLDQAERWRRQVLREISMSVTRIQNGSIGEHRIRDLNDQINKLLVEKRHWETRCRQLGGGDFSRGPVITDTDGKIVQGHGGYLYFGAARDLPGVRELLEKRAAESTAYEKKFDLKQLNQAIDIQYYGLLDENLADLERIERKAEIRAWHKAIGPLQESDRDRIDADRDLEIILREPRQPIPIPTQSELDQQLLEHRKQQLLAQIAQ